MMGMVRNRLGKASAVAHAIQGLVKYHGLKNRKLRIPFHDSISVCVEALTTKTTIEFNSTYDRDNIEINGAPALDEAVRVMAVISPLRSYAKTKLHFRLSSHNSLTQGKGLGFSASAFASICLASSSALGLNLDLEQLSEIARLGAGSASRSMVGGFSIWYANRNGRSFARQLPAGKMRLAMAVAPVPSKIRTEMAHEESVGSPFFQTRLREVKKMLPKMLHAIRLGDIDEVGRLTELESRSLHAVTMTGRTGLLLITQETIRLLQGVIALREEHQIPVWYSQDTGPSVYINTYPDYLDKVCSEIEKSTNCQVIKSGVGGPARTIDEHLF